MLSILLFIGGCLQSEEFLTINKDGSGTLEANLVVPEGTVMLIDSIFGTVAKGMESVFGEDVEQKNSTESIAQEIFANKEEILSKADRAGLNLEFTDFNKEIKGKAIKVHYKFKFDDIAKFLNSDILNAKFGLTQDAQGNAVFVLESDPRRREESTRQMQQFREWQESDAAKTAEFDVPKILNTMKDFCVSFTITMPNEIVSTSGLFAKKSSQTASIEFRGDLLSDASIIEKLYGGTAEPSQIVCRSEGANFKAGGEKVQNDSQDNSKEISNNPLAGTEEPFAAQYSVDTKVKLYLKDGRVIEGRITEKTQDAVKVDSVGVPISYYKDDIQQIEALSSK